MCLLWPVAFIYRLKSYALFINGKNETVLYRQWFVIERFPSRQSWLYIYTTFALQEKSTFWYCHCFIISHTYISTCNIRIFSQRLPNSVIYKTILSGILAFGTEIEKLLDIDKSHVGALWPVNKTYLKTLIPQ
jgi:hypothetical protein